MIAITDINNLVRDLRAVIMQQAELDGKYVLNAIQLKGPIMHANEGTQGQMLFKSFSQDDTVIIFELMEGDDEEMSDPDEDYKEFVYMPYRMHIMMYGNTSATKAKILKTRLLTEEVRLALMTKGINLIDCTKIESSPEIINDCIWQRKDFYINFSSYMLVSRVTSIQDYLISSDIKVEK